jgi:Family of unknown function (DUF6516)
VISLASVLSAVMAILQSHPLCRHVTVLEAKSFSPDQFFFKIRADLDGYRFQVRIYHNKAHTDYAYQLFADTPLLRWDNKEEFRHLETYPHHHHDAQGGIRPSSLTGNPVQDIQVVLQQVSAFIAQDNH